MLHLLALAGALPALIAMFLVDRADARRPEPRSTLRRVALFGALSMVPAAILELGLQRVGPAKGTIVAALYFALVAALVEEACKGLVVRWFVWNRPEFDERTDGIVYGARAGLGFALLENVGYLLGARTMSGFIGIFVVRAVLTVPMHAAAGGLMGHFAAWRRFERRGPGALGGYAIAVALHGAFDGCALPMAALVKQKEVGAIVALALGMILTVGIATLSLRRAWRTALAADDAASLRGGAELLKA